jgi:4-amino-4-deoxy-L-arabinose transferase-like glycosyltransferase
VILLLTGNRARTLGIVLTFVLGAAFVLRVAGIVHQSIWYDEGLSIYYARGSVGDLWRGASQSEHPPLHSLLLHLWMVLFGDSEFSVRLLSAWWGVLAVALLYRLGRRLSSAAGVLAALLLAFSPLAIWYSQETRGYVMALALVTATVIAAWKLVPLTGELGARADRARWTPYLLYVVLATAALYTHLYSAFVLLALNVAWAVQYAVVGRRRRVAGQLFRWAGAQIAVLALFSPWLPHVVAQWRLNATYYHGAVDWKQIIRRTLLAFSVGETLEGPWAVAATWALLGLAVLGTIVLSRRRRVRVLLMLLWLWMLVPAAFQIVLNRNLPKFAPRYLLNALPPFLLLASMGILWLLDWLQLEGIRSGRARPARAARPDLNAGGWLATCCLLLSTAVIGGATARSLANHYLDERLYRPDVRGAARYIEEHATAQDLIVLVGGHSYPAFAYYYRGALPVLSLPDGLLPDTRSPVDVGALGVLDRAIAGRRQLWLVLWQEHLADPTGLVVDELEHTYHRLGVGRTFHDVGLLLFDVSPGPRLAQGAAPSSQLRALFQDQIWLQGYDLPERETQPGGTLYLYLYWESIGRIDHDYKVFTQILDEGGNIIAQHDKIAGAESYPTSHWPQGALVRDRLMLTVRSDASPGRYVLIAGLYRPGRAMTRLQVSGQGAQGDHVVLADILIGGG